MSGFIQVEIPNQFLCPITLDIMSDPVICSDGYTYERVSILALKNSLSPMTRQPIDKTILIPNIALRQLIEQYTQTLTQTQLKINQDKLKDLKREREEILTRFEKEQKEQHKPSEQVINIIEILIQQEDKELEKIVIMFNTKDLPILRSGWKSIINGKTSWNNYCTVKFKFNINIIKNIKNIDIDELLTKYFKLCEDLMWIQKYVYGFGDSKPFVDYVYDYKEKNCIDSDLKNIEEQIGEFKLHIKRNYNTCESLNRLNLTLEQLINFKKILDSNIKPREHYYTNYEDFLDLFGTKNEFGIREFISGGIPDYHPINLDSYTSSVFYEGSGYSANKYFFHQFHIFDREKKDKLNFLISFCESLGIIKYLGTCLSSCGIPLFPQNYNPISHYYGKGDLIKDHIEFINWNISEGPYCRRLVKSEDFNEIFKLGKIIVELIEFVRPELILLIN